ncbi:MAG: Ribosomal RNA small subunit methyltransferase I [Candidatus Woesebacteria bacterium GW2011_GWB1_38_5b]|uniref:Ribosomal RNA small subunit methyltransferase I n=1 Tax=Candidatus Woesebacteria bacterium GW2011_GWB1_38_5b TaxID=1618569 RepID=A0A0G0MNR3_9BACT|nr:MAG: Ribosomal RNA small subunit methyltransferase I [Candidatus Woesebacteria bacterium GW2011_GWB1_38_5b]OGH47749.1 MAG: 16S rRNA (cytidine(1402)-2'-O)-methyltransferase [Candidatus Levybacteria bacterium RIFCSPLOWO2_01_FULL_39_10]
MEHKGTLYIVATPIGNLQDITLRAIEVFKKVDYIACEDTRKAGFLLKNLNIANDGMLISFYEEVEEKKTENILNILKNGQDVALVSDSGTPLISDPGFRLIRACLQDGINVVSVPGPSACISALVSSGLPPDKFIFLGFLPKKEGKRMRLLEELKTANHNLEATVIIYEAPHRLIKTLKNLSQVFGDVNIVIMREMTKIHEQRLTGNIKDMIIEFENRKPKGEIVILLTTKY